MFKMEEEQEIALPVCLPARPACGYAPGPRPEPQHKKYHYIKKRDKQRDRKVYRT